MTQELTYFAYGSNLDIGGMRRRCLGAVALGRARLADYELVFETGTGTLAYANVRPRRDAIVPGALYRLTPADLAPLDRYEDAPLLYTRRSVAVSDDAGNAVQAMLYVMVESSRSRLRSPRLAHLRAIERGYEDWKLPPAILHDALARSADP